MMIDTDDIEALQFFLQELREASEEAVKNEYDDYFETLSSDHSNKVARKFENSLSYLAHFAANNAES